MCTTWRGRAAGWQNGAPARETRRNHTTRQHWDAAAEPPENVPFCALTDGLGYLNDDDRSNRAG